jgi:hypothetical protein
MLNVRRCQFLTLIGGAVAAWQTASELVELAPDVIMAQQVACAPGLAGSSMPSQPVRF